MTSYRNPDEDVPTNPRPLFGRKSPNRYTVVSGDGIAESYQKIGGRDYPLVTNTKCKTCTSEHRPAIEGGILQGYTYDSIIARLPEDAGLTARNLRNHLNNGHMPQDLVLGRKIIEARAQELGRNVENYDGALTDHVSFIRLGVHKVMQRMLAGEIEPDLDHGIQMANLWHQMEKAAGVQELDYNMILAMVMQTTLAINRHADPDTRQRIIDDISRNPIMIAMRRKLEQRAELEAGGVVDTSPLIDADMVALSEDVFSEDDEDDDGPDHYPASDNGHRPD